ncbi:hypothetical protein ACEUZ9_000175 [Paracoccus litorisediminis]|uniref:hypothetical protein n=1 Tax=Paracoccus litorisediminis TaxID=2006130 RepID=UPI0037346FBC
MKGSRHPEEYDERFIDCEADLEAEILAVLDRAEAVGWGRAEAIAAIKSLCENIQLGDEANGEMWEGIVRDLARPH